MHVNVVNHTRVTIDGNSHILCCHFITSQHAINLYCALDAFLAIVLGDCLGSICILQRQLLVSYHITSGQHVVVVAQDELYIHHHITCRAIAQGSLDGISINLDGCGLLLRQIDLLDVLLVNLLAIYKYRYQHADIVRTSKELLVVDRDGALLQIYVLYPIVLVSILYFVGVGMEATVGCNDTITVEVVVAGGITTRIATVHPYLIAGYLALATNSLVNHIPDETTLIFGVLANQIHVEHEATH